MPDTSAKLTGASLAVAYEEVRAAIGKPARCSYNGNGTYRVLPLNGPSSPCSYCLPAAEVRRRLAIYRERLAPRPPAWVATVDADPA